MSKMLNTASASTSFRRQLKVIRWLILTLFLLMVGVAAILFFCSMNEEVPGRGVVVGLRSYDLKSSVQSRISKIHFREGDQVKAGDILLELDDRQVANLLEIQKNSIQELEAEIIVKEWSLKLLRSDPLPEEYRHTKIALEESRTRTDTSAMELETYRKLYEKKVVSEMEFHRREMDHTRNKAELEKLETDYAKLEAGLAEQIIGLAESELAMLRVRLAGRHKELQLSERQMEEYRFVAPEDGTITYIPTKIGAYVEPGQVMVQLAAAGGKKFIAYIDETEVYKIREGQEVRISSSQYSTFEYGYFHGEVLYVGELPEERGGKTVYPVFILMTDEPQPLRLGSTGEAKITVGASRIITNLTGMTR